MFNDSDLLPLSALQHFVYCPRQCALIHLEQQWTENRFTAEGRAAHDRVDRPEHETRDGVRYEYAVLLRSLKLGLIGKADVVEFHEDKVFPVEHKPEGPPFGIDEAEIEAVLGKGLELAHMETPATSVKPRRGRERLAIFRKP